MDSALRTWTKRLLLDTPSISAGRFDRLEFGGLSRHLDGQCEEKRAPGAGFGFHPDASGVQLDNLLHDWKTDARACGFLIVISIFLPELSVSAGHMPSAR